MESLTSKRSWSQRLWCLLCWLPIAALAAQDGLDPSLPRPLSFVAPRDFEIGDQAGSIAVGDFNRDGVQDLAAVISIPPGAGEVGVAIVRGLGGGTFGPPEIILRPSATAKSVAVGDFNGDGLADLAVVVNAPFSGPGSLFVLLGNGDGTFGEPSSFSAGTSSPSKALAVGDFDRDGNLDVVVTNSGPSISLSVLLGNGDGTFHPANVIDLGVSPLVAWSVAVADFDEDGNLDVAVGLHSGTFICVLLGDGQGSFQPPVRYETGIRPEVVAVADFNRDGHADLAVTLAGQAFPPVSGGVSVLLGNGDGTFQPLSSFPGGVFNPSQIVAVDFDGDGKLDLAVGNDTANDISVLLGNGDGTFRPAVSFATGNHPNSIAIGDFNNDGKPDLATANIPTDVGAYSVSVLMNDSIQRRGY